MPHYWTKYTNGEALRGLDTIKFRKGDIKALFLKANWFLMETEFNNHACFLITWKIIFVKIKNSNIQSRKLLVCARVRRTKRTLYKMKLPHHPTLRNKDSSKINLYSKSPFCSISIFFRETRYQLLRVTTAKTGISSTEPKKWQKL